MASIRKEIALSVPAADVWDAVRDVGALHRRLVRGFVLDTRLEDGARVVTFANGMVVRELIVDVDDQARRLVWIADLLPDELAGDIRAMIDHGAAAMRATLEAP
jgi:hypothetical protein